MKQIVDCIIQRKNRLKFTFMLLLVGGFYASCGRTYKGETERIRNAINKTMQTNQDSYIIVSKSKIKIIPGGFPVKYFKNFYGEEIESAEESDIVVVEYGEKRIIQVLRFEDVKSSDINIGTTDYSLGDTIFISKSRSYSPFSILIDSK